MKILQIMGDMVHWDATPKVRSLVEAYRLFAPDMVFVEAPDFVFEGWGFDGTATGDDRFIRPVPPEGWNYDDKTGTFYRDGEVAKSSIKTNEQLMQENAELQETVTELELALAEVYEMTIALVNGGANNG